MDGQQLPVPKDKGVPAAQADKKGNLLSKSRDFIQGAVDSISGKELPRLVEDFTRDMVIVAEGLSADQEGLRTTLHLQADEQDKLARQLRENEKKLNDLAKKVDALSQKAEKRQKGESGLKSILRQATWLAAIIGGAWVITTLVNALVK
ncbi:MAG: hypothetical protein GX171_07925 [Clostridiales bacterium]|jgi:hypothetical protein|nr:hypothetical protein [Clostridiales bacterium]